MDNMKSNISNERKTVKKEKKIKPVTPKVFFEEQKVERSGIPLYDPPVSIDIEPAIDTDIDEGNALAIEVPEVPSELVESDKVIIQDETDVSLKFAFIGSGQAGCRLVNMFHKDMGYRRTLLFNTTKQDLEGLNAPEEMIYPFDREDVHGAGKDMKKGYDALNSVKEHMYRFFKQRFGDAVDRIIICFGAGGGTGSGTVIQLIDLAKSYLMDLNVPNIDKKVGCIMSLPSRSEGAIVNQNAYEIGQQLCNKAKNGQISPLLIIDNEKIRKLYSQIPVGRFWPVTNKTIVQLFNIFAYMASRSSEFSTFDLEDYQSVLSAGMLTCGMSNIKAYKPGIDLPKMFRENLKKNLFATDLDFSTVTHAAAILAADRESLDIIPQDVIETTFESLTSLFVNKKGLMMHRGIYESSKPGIKMFTIIGGFKAPQSRLREIYKLGGEDIE